MSQIHLYTTYYPEKKAARRTELQQCLSNNLANKAISSITVFNEGGDLSDFKNDKVKVVPISQRPTYQDFFEYINKNSPSDHIHIIANTDIYFDEHIGVLKYLDLEGKALALSRWDATGFTQPQLYNKNSSQDVWVFKGPIKAALQADFPLGVPRCDNRLMYELEQGGYTVLNPAFSIKAYHIHEGQRALVYTEDDNIYKIPSPYRYKYPHNCWGFWKTLWFNCTHQEQLGRYRYDLKKLNNWWVIRLPRKVLEIVLRKKMPLIGYK